MDGWAPPQSSPALPCGPCGSQGMFSEAFYCRPTSSFLDKKTEVWRDEAACSKADSQRQGQCGVRQVSSTEEGIKGATKQNSGSSLIMSLFPLFS